ncbi:M48 family metallopeptidase [Chitinilyticum litopenaei]|uniref:M48 family metallopeptidase n=1 Tax=Chitinilyticum litopenaei TaxID=1121276 RepID=UPI00041100AB|nr:SprT family zinc-dependent metalloprotease [Chitinilyticum litopenaei]
MAASAKPLLVEFGPGQALPLLWTRSPRRRTVQLLVRADGQIEVKAPQRLPWSAIEPFVKSRYDWLLAARQRMHARAAATPPQADLSRLSWLGQTLVIRPGTRTRLADGGLDVAGADDAQRRQNLARFMQRSARVYLAERLQLWAGRMGLQASAFALSGARGRWGSCSSTGAIRLNWRLMQAPPAVIDYVVIHELAHLQELNHSPRFWAIVASHCPDWKQHRLLLKEHGERYMQIG